MFVNVRSSLLLVSSLACLAPVAQSQTPAQTAPAQIAPAKVAIINAQKAVADTQEIKKAQATLEAKYRPRQQSIESLNRDLQSIQQQLRTPNLAPDKEAQLNAQGSQKQRELQRLTEDLQSDVDHERQDILSHAGRQMQAIVKKIAEDRSIDVVVDITNTIYYKPTLDITPEATVEYDKAYPAK